MDTAREIKTPPSNTPWEKLRIMTRLDKAALLCAVIIFAAGLFDLLGWTFNIAVFKSIVPGWQPMSWISASCFILCSIQVALMLFFRRETASYPALKMPAMLAGAVGSLVFFMYVADILNGPNVHFEFNPALDYIYHNTSTVNMYTAVLFMAFGAALLLAFGGRPGISHGLAIPAFLAGYFVMASYTLGVESTHEFLNVRIAFNTGFSFCALGMAVFLAEPDTWLMRVFTGKNLGSVMTRNMLPGVMLIPLAIAWLRIAGERTGFFSSEVGVVLVAMVYTLCFLALLWLNAGSVNRADAERRAAEEAVKSSEAMLNQAQKVAHLGSWELDLVNNKLMWSDEVYRIFGLKPQEFGATYEAFLENIYPDDRDRVDEAYSSSLRENRDTYEIEHRVVRKDTGEVRVVHEKCTHFRGGAGEIIRSVGMVHDITDRVEAEDKLRSANEELTAMNEELASMNEELASTNEELNVSLEVQAMAEAALRASSQRFELLSRTASALLRAGNPEAAINELCLTVMQKLDCHVFFNYIVVDAAAGRLRLNAYAGIGEEEAKRISTLNFGSAVCGCVARDCAPIVASNIQQTPDPRTELVKSYGIKAYACHPIVGRDGKAAGTLSFGTRNREEFSAEDITLMKAVTAEISVAMIRVKNEQELKKSHSELEERVKERTTALLEAQKQVERGKRLSDIGTLASTVAHELRNPLATIGIAAYNIKRKTKDKKLSDHVINIQKKVKESDQIINNLLFYSRIKPPALEKASLKGIIKESVDDIRERAKKGVTIDVKAGSLDGVLVEADPVQLREVFNNLLNNAVEAVPAGRGSIEIEGDAEDGKVIVTVRDNGSGIDSAHLEKVFDPFFTTKSKGTGLGLAVCRQIMNNHNGSIWLESELKKGTAAHVAIPKIKEAADAGEKTAHN